MDTLFHFVLALILMVLVMVPSVSAAMSAGDVIALLLGLILGILGICACIGHYARTRGQWCVVEWASLKRMLSASDQELLWICLSVCLSCLSLIFMSACIHVFACMHVSSCVIIPMSVFSKWQKNVNMQFLNILGFIYIYIYINKWYV